MASIQFRFSTECEMTLQGDSYEDIYLQFKDFIHGDQQVAKRASITVFPPESVQIFFDIEASGENYEIANFKGDYRSDIAGNCPRGELQSRLGGA